MQSVLKVVRVHVHTKFQAIPSMHSPYNVQNPQSWPFSLNQSCTTVRNINRLWPKSNQFGRWPRSGCQIAGHSFCMFSWECTETPNFQIFWLGCPWNLTDDLQKVIWVRLWRCGCLVTWFCYQLTARPSNKKAAPSWPDPYVVALHKVIIFCKYHEI